MPVDLTSKQKPPQTRSEVLIDTTNDNLYMQQQTNTPAQNLVLPNSAKNMITSPRDGPHVPVKVHVANKPTVEDITRVYNPYPLHNEYEKYVKDGFLFEPLKNQKQTGQQQANVAFSSEVISPYARTNTGALEVKNRAQNDKLLNVARHGQSNVGFEREKTSEFQKRVPSGGSVIPVTHTTSSAPSIHKQYEDELDLANRFYKSAGTNAEIVNNINKEIERLKSGYKNEAGQEAKSEHKKF
jgi:hypothetical protein